MRGAPQAAGWRAPDGNLEGRRLTISGIVQGVGFRPWVHRVASAAGIAGRVWNDSAGATIEAFGPTHALERFAAQLRAAQPPAARIESIITVAIAPEALHGFEIVGSMSSDERHVSIPADIATCPECLREVFDPDDRRHRYAFTNCTNCGPRFTITRDIPYDRDTTTMAEFEMCAECRTEYEAADNRRYHAEPNACPRCGPRLELVGEDGAAVERGDTIAVTAAVLAKGAIVAIKGLGGFHLACDATNAAAVRRLRERKGREEKPLAVMVRDLPAAARLAEIDETERRLLVSSERPIVLLRRRAGCAIAPEVAPGNPMLGVMLPYSPLHHLLMGEFGRPLVMTSGNLSEEPIVYRNGEARARLGGVADSFLIHDREIVTRCDDSVARVIASSPTLIRRSRGYVPRPIMLASQVRRPVLGCGAQLKNTFCLAAGDRAYLGPHIGDLDNLATFESFEESIARMERFTGIAPEIVAHDMHPDYLSSRYAHTRSGATRIAVQHHHAHIASAMAEHRLTQSVIGAAFDGTGYGPDGESWGGEVMVADFAGFERLATFRALRLAGGDTAIREVWRIALAAVLDAFGDEAPLDSIPLFQKIAPRDLAVVRRMITGEFNAPLAHGVGRYFDAFGALALEAPMARFEGQIAMGLEGIAERSETARYGYAIDAGAAPAQVDLRDAVRGAVTDAIVGCAPATIAAKFHNTVVAATVELIRAAQARCGRLAVVLTGGCFQNARLAEGVASALAGQFDVYLHREVPPGDGGIALGQAMVADAQARMR